MLDGICTKFNARALVVEDNFMNQELIKALLTRMDVEVETASDGEEALELFQENDFDIVFMDILMPKKDGYQVTRDIRALEGGRKHTPVIAVTASAMMGDQEKCLAAGMDDYIAKPIRGEHLEAILTKHLPPSACVVR